MLVPSIQKYEANTVLFRQGMRGDVMYVIHSGRVKLVRKTENSIETMTTLEQGDFFGEMAVIEGILRSATAIVQEEGTELIILDRKQFETLLKSDIEIPIRMIRKYAQRLIETKQPT